MPKWIPQMCLGKYSNVNSPLSFSPAVRQYAQEPLAPHRHLAHTLPFSITILTLAPTSMSSNVIPEGNQLRVGSNKYRTFALPSAVIPATPDIAFANSSAIWVLMCLLMLAWSKVMDTPHVSSHSQRSILGSCSKLGPSKQSGTAWGQKTMGCGAPYCWGVSSSGRG